MDWRLIVLVLLLLWATGALGPVYRWFVRYFQPEVWSALGTWIAVAVAVVTVIVAGRYAKYQVDEARRTREELAQPNVALFAELNHTDWQVIEIVVKNFGNTPAYHITFDFKGTPLKRCPSLIVAEPSDADNIGNIADVYFPEEIAYLALGQEWRTVWDDSQSRRKYSSDAENFFGDRAFYPEGIPTEKLLRKRHEVDIEFEDARGKKFPKVPCVIDFEIFDEASLLHCCIAEG